MESAALAVVLPNWIRTARPLIGLQRSDPLPARRYRQWRVPSNPANEARRPVLLGGEDWLPDYAGCYPVSDFIYL